MTLRNFLIYSLMVTVFLTYSLKVQALTDAERKKLLQVIPGYGVNASPTPTSTPEANQEPEQESQSQSEGPSASQPAKAISSPTPTQDSNLEAQILQLKQQVGTAITQVEANQQLPKDKKDLLLQNLKKMQGYSKDEWIKVLDLIKSGKLKGLTP